MWVTSVEILTTREEEELADILSRAENVDSFDILPLEGGDEKSVVVFFGEPVDIRFLDDALKNIFGTEE